MPIIDENKYQYVDDSGKRFYTYKFYTDITPDSGNHPLNMNKIATIFSARGNWIESPQKDAATLMYIDLYSFAEQKKTYSYKSDITNIIRSIEHQSINKSNLYKLLQTYNPIITEKFMMRQYDINLDNYKSINSNIFSNPFILKPVHSWGGSGIVILDNYDSYKLYLDEYSKKNFKFKSKSKRFRPEWVLAEYIEKPMLFKNRKFHLRIPFLYYKKRGYVAKEYRIVTAASEYKAFNYNVKSIHDTHTKGSLKNYFFPQDLEKNNIPHSTIQSIQTQIDELFSHLTQIMENNNFNYQCFDNTKHCFTIYGADVMITHDHKIKLLEINTRSGFTYNGDYVERMINDIAIIVLDDLYPPENSVPDKLQFFKHIPKILRGGYYDKYLKYKKKYLSLQHNLKN